MKRILTCDLVVMTGDGVCGVRLCTFHLSFLSFKADLYCTGNSVLFPNLIDKTLSVVGSKPFLTSQSVLNNSRSGSVY